MIKVGLQWERVSCLRETQCWQTDWVAGLDQQSSRRSHLDYVLSYSEGTSEGEDADWPTAQNPSYDTRLYQHSHSIMNNKKKPVRNSVPLRCINWLIEEMMLQLRVLSVVSISWAKVLATWYPNFTNYLYTSFQGSHILMTTNSRTFPGPSKHFSWTFKDKQQLLTVHTRRNLMHTECQIFWNLSSLYLSKQVLHKCCTLFILNAQ